MDTMVSNVDVITLLKSLRKEIVFSILHKGIIPSFYADDELQNIILMKEAVGLEILLC